MEISGYNILDTLGEGSIATVYLAIQVASGREVALKVVSADISSRSDFMEQFAAQSHPASHLKHPNIAALYDQGFHAGQAYLAMEYLRGRTLRHRRFELGLAEQLQVVKDLASALEFMGQRGIVHGNIRPENVIFHTDDGRPILTDLGMPPSSGGGIDPDFYQSPEECRGASLDWRSDIYSLGGVLFLLLCGQFPRVKVCLKQPDADNSHYAPPQLPSELAVFQPIVTRTLAKDPADRYQSGAELAQALAAISPEQLENVISASEQALMREGESTEAPIPEPSTSEGSECQGGRQKEVVMEAGEYASVEALTPEQQEGPVGDVALNVVPDDLTAVSVTAHREDRIDLQGTPSEAHWGTIAFWALLIIAVATGAMLMVRP